mmetsp:Transcript_3539/g.5126  ORF Transcript_3539/g.5126 Transcript_3539/m.5126 type:complete len:183 (+) Transcript_3539:383-931(+)
MGLLWWILESQVEIVRVHAAGLEDCAKAGSITARMISIWAPIMCFPQWVLGFLYGAIGWHPEAAAVFCARMAAMCIVRKLDEHIPLQRALGLCHLLTFGPVWLWLLTREPVQEYTGYFSWFMWLEMRVIPLCLFLDFRDLVLHVAGFPYPVYIREGVLGGTVKLADPRARRPVSWISRLLGP